MAVRDRRGRQEARETREAKLKRPNVRAYYGRELTDVRPGQFEYRVTLMRGAGVAPLALDRVVEQVTWTDEGDELVGSLRLRRPDGKDSVPIGVGHRVKLEVRWAGGWYELWQMAVQPPSGDPASGVDEVELKDDLAILAANRRDWSFRKTKKRGKGWLPQEVTRAVAARAGVRVGALPEGKHRINRLVKKGVTDLSVIIAAWEHEKDKTNERYILRMRNGRLEVVTLRRNAILYVLKEQIQAAATEQKRKMRPVTVIVARGRIGKGKDAKKVTRTVYSSRVVRRYGRVSREKDYGTVRSVADLRAQARVDLAKELRVEYTASVTVPGVPFIRRGDGAQWITDEPGWSGSTTEIRDRSFVYVTRVSNTVAADGQTTDLEFTQQDPFAKEALRLDRARRKAAEARRKAKKKD